MFGNLLEEPVGIFLIIVAVILLAPMLSTLVRLPGIYRVDPGWCGDWTIRAGLAGA